MLFLAVVQEFLEEQRYRGNSNSTITYYETRLHRFAAEGKITRLADFTEGAVRTWLLGKGSVSRNTVANYDRALRVFANWLAHRGYVEANPMARLPKPRLKHGRIITW